MYFWSVDRSFDMLRRWSAWDVPGASSNFSRGELRLASGHAHRARSARKPCARACATRSARWLDVAPGWGVARAVPAHAPYLSWSSFAPATSRFCEDAVCSSVRGQDAGRTSGSSSRVALAGSAGVRRDSCVASGTCASSSASAPPLPCNMHVFRRTARYHRHAGSGGIHGRGERASPLSEPRARAAERQDARTFWSTLGTVVGNRACDRSRHERSMRWKWSPPASWSSSCPAPRSSIAPTRGSASLGPPSRRGMRCGGSTFTAWRAIPPRMS